MWFKFPKGTEGITVEHQAFSTEIKDDADNSYFRAPDHFATRILGVPGFSLAEPPEGAPADLPRADPLRDGAIAELTKGHEATKMEVQNLRADLGAAQAKVTQLMNENNNLKLQLQQSLDKIDDLQEQIEDMPTPGMPVPAQTSQPSAKVK